MLRATLWPLCNSRLELVFVLGREVRLLRKKGRESLRLEVTPRQGDVRGRQCHLLFAQ